MMIESIEVINFQSHEDSKLEFSPGVNIIVGTSDSGKTAIIRALNWITFNRPLGNAFRSYWAKETSVTVSGEDFLINRTKGKSDAYTLHSEELPKPIVFKAFGTKVPQEIQGRLNLSPINLQQQLDSPYLLTDSPGAVAAHFNKIAKLQVIDKASQNVDKWLREMKTTLDSNKVNLKQAEEELKAFKDIEKAEARLEVLESKINERNKLSKDVSTLSTLLTSCSATVVEINERKAFLAICPAFDALNEKYEVHSKTIEHIEELSSLLAKVYTSDTEKEENEAIISFEPTVDAILKKIDTFKKSEKKIFRLSNTIGEIEDLEHSIQIKKKKLKKDTTFLAENMPEVCPLCETTLK